MRVALLTMIETTGEVPVPAAPVPAAGAPGGAVPPAARLRASLPLGGATLARHQLGTVLALGCDRVICVAQTLDPAMLELQRIAEYAGARFHVVPGPRGLLGLVTATDEVFALADGFNAPPEPLQELLEAGPGVLVQPIERGLQAGFERIDINHAAGGAWRIPGRLVERLADLPPDCDPFSTLQRIALQAGIAQRMVPTAALDSGQWTLVRSEAEAHARESAWIRGQLAALGRSNPTLWLARLAVGQFGGALLHSGNGVPALVGAGVTTTLLGAVAGWFDFPVIGLGLAAAAWLLFVAAMLLGRIHRATLRMPPPRLPRQLIFGVVIDLLMIALLDWMAARSAGLAVSQSGLALFAPVMLVGLCRLVGASGNARWNAWLQDHALLALVLIVATVIAPVVLAVEALALAVLVAGIVAALRRQSA